MAISMRKERDRRHKRGALMAGFGMAITGASNWYNQTQQNKAKELRHQELAALKNRELDLGRDKLEASNLLGEEKNRIDALAVQNQADQIQAITDNAKTADKKASMGTFLTNDLEKWKSNFIGAGDNSKLRAQAWASVFKNDLSTYSAESLQDIAANINDQFGPGTNGKPLLSFDEIQKGVDQLRTYAEMRGLTPEDVTDDNIRSLLSSSFTMGDAPVVDDSLMGDGAGGTGGETPPADSGTGIAGLDLSKKLSGLGGVVGSAADSLRGYPDRSAEPGAQTSPESKAAGFDRGITQTPNEPGVMGEWWLNLDPEQVAAMPAAALPPEAIAWLQEQGLQPQG